MQLKLEAVEKLILKNKTDISWEVNIMWNKFHRHRYKIIGTGHNQNRIEVDLMCKCGKHGTVLVEKRFEKRILDQAAKGKYFSVPRIICVMDE